MGKLLRKLGLQKKLPAELDGAAKGIGGAEDGLSSVQKKDLKLKASVGTIVDNLNDLDGKVEPALLDRKKGQLASLNRRIAGRKTDDPGLKTDALELQMVAAETQAVVKGSDANLGALKAARTRYGEGLVARLDGGGNLAGDLKKYVDDHTRDGNTNRVDAALAGLDGLKGHADPRIAAAAAKATAELAAEALAAAGKAGPSTAEREAPRTPNDVLVHLSTVVDKSLKTVRDVEVGKVSTAAREMFMNHTLDAGKVQGLADQAALAFEAQGDAGNAAMCRKLKGQLNKRKQVGDEGKPDEAATPTRAQLTDNLYGRAFDTKMVSSLVKDPPDELLGASEKSGKAFAAMLPDDADTEEAAMSFVKNYVKGDQRPWSGAVPLFDELAKVADGKEALVKIKAFLDTKPSSGQEVIATSYMMAKIPLSQQKIAGEKGKSGPAWLTEASKNYGKITPEANRQRGAAAPVVSTAAGITMLHQPDASGDDTLVPSERPGTANRMGIRKEGVDIPDTGLSQQNELQLNQALPFASGVSGTTNILVHLYAEMEKGGATGVKPNEFLMNAMMFLVYDGGHSMHEAMYTANQIETELKTVAFGLSDPTSPDAADPKAFVSDYDRFMDGFDGPLKAAMKGAQDEAWEGTQAYLEKNSIFA